MACFKSIVFPNNIRIYPIFGFRSFQDKFRNRFFKKGVAPTVILTLLSEVFLILCELQFLI